MNPPNHRHDVDWSWVPDAIEFGLDLLSWIFDLLS
jgi:hypothetical protein